MKTKNMYRILAICCALLVTMGTTTALAIESRASEMFNETYVMVNSKLETEFGAGTKKIAKSIYVSSCILQELDKNNRVIASTNLTPPDKVVNNGSDYTATAKYSGISGKRYRIKAVFYADGYTVTSYSRILICE